MDDLDEFERRQRSFDQIEQHRATLAAEAARIAREHPAARLVGLVIEADAPEAAAFLRMLAPGTPTVGSFVGIVPRKMAVELLSSNAPQGLDWLEDDPVGSKRKLPILVVTKTGYRTGVAEYEPGLS